MENETNELNKTNTTNTTSTTCTTKHINDRPDSLELSTPSKGGALKVYFNADDPVETTQARILSAIAARKFASEKIEQN